MTTISDLPVEVLLHIFQYYVETEKQKNLLKVIAKVCLNWKKIYLNSSLWAKYDGTLGFQQLKRLCKSGSLNNSKVLILSEMDELKDEDADQLFTVVKNVEVIDFRKVEKLSDNTLSVVGSNCSKLKEIHIGRKNSKNPITLDYKILGSFFPVVGGGLVTINFSYCLIKNFQLCIRCISDCCPNLENLKLLNVGRHDAYAFPTKYVQMHCPKLKTLYLDQSIRIMSNKHSSGFPNLETFSYGDNDCVAMDDKNFECIVFNAPNLKFLSLTNCNVSAAVLCSLPACSVEYLYISRCKVTHMNALSDVLKKWSHSLIQVDVSYGNNYAINKAIFCLVTTPVQSPLKYLCLNFTKIIPAVIEEVLRSCTNLELLELEGCRNLGRGMKRTYSGKNEFGDLTAKIKVFKSSHPELVETIDLY